LLDDSKQGLRFHGLAHNGDRPGLLGSLRNVAISRHYYDGNVGKPRFLASLGKEPQPSSTGISTSRRINPGWVSEGASNRSASLPFAAH
jgi:hypothetical protein